MIKAVLFDLDGLLVNSEQLYLEANKAYFKQFGFDFTEDHHRDGTGKKFETWITTVVSINKSGEKILSERNIVFFELVKEKLTLLEGASDLLHEVTAMKTALVTSSKSNYVDLVFQKTGIDMHFDEVITGDMVHHGKPHPEGYLMAAKKLGVEPEECIVFEDAPSGVLAGKNAGMKVIAIPSPYVKGDKAFLQADIVVSSLQKVNLTVING